MCQTKVTKIKSASETPKGHSALYQTTDGFFQIQRKGSMWKIHLVSDDPYADLIDNWLAMNYHSLTKARLALDHAQREALKEIRAAYDELPMTRRTSEAPRS